jgi:hypothetical protein
MFERVTLHVFLRGRIDMCVSFANSIQAWTCRKELARRDSMLAIWAGTIDDRICADPSSTALSATSADENKLAAATD